MDVAGARMTTAEQLTADGGIFREAAALQLYRIYRRFVIIELPNEVIAVCNCRPAEKWIGLPLHGALAFRNALALMRRRASSGAMTREIRRIRRAGLFLDLEEERIVFTVALEVDEVIAK